MNEGPVKDCGVPGGGMTTEHTVWCGSPRCVRYGMYSSNTKREAAQLARNDGWSLTKGGWRCLNCVREPQESK